MRREFKNYIDGQWCDAVSGKRFENRNPAYWDEVLGTFPDSNLSDVDRAVQSAAAAFEAWRLTPAPQRGEIIQRAGNLLWQHKEEIAREMTKEMGKILLETRGDVQEGIDTAFYAASEGRRLFGYTAPSELPDKFNLSIRLPVGVAGIITPWNFPLAIPTWKIFPALVCGNTVVFKPAEDTPATAVRLVEILLDAGLPDKVIQLVHGNGPMVGMPLVEHPGVKLISFTGSTQVGKLISAAAAKELKRVSLELGGKNAQIVMPDADLDLALEGVLWGAFGTAGQRCTATSRLILHEAIHDKFLAMLIKRAEKLRLGDGLEPSTEVGPLINQKQLDKVQSDVRLGHDEGAKLETGGERFTDGACRNGFFFRPTIFSNVDPEMRIAQEEIFGPVLAVIKVSSLAQAIRVLNNTKYGLSSSIYTRDVNSAFKAIRDIEAGITYVNGPTIGAEAHMPFGGVKETGNGHREGGWPVYDFFTELKTVYVDYSGKLQRAQIDNQ
ncbi:MAG: aldehyde dehydrogenase family protein [candidate division KSB1 bacterium]|nr:aldehyde dehydrogenase family protein [candidate division KSB1 bacterium]